MPRTSQRRIWPAIVIGSLALAALAAQGSIAVAKDHGAGLYVPPANSGARAQIRDLRRSGQDADAKLIEDLIGTPQAVWFTKGTPKQVEKSVRATLKRAKGHVAVLVAYNIPGRDCANLSAGGALTTAEYEAWIDAFARGIGKSKTIVILEPDALGLLPSNCGAGFPFTDAQRFAELNYAVDRIAAQPNAMVYLDGTHSAWLNVGDLSTRLVQAGVQRAQGFFLNVSNYQFAPNSARYGTWVSECIAYATSVAPGDFGGCPNQYWNGGPHPAQIADLLGEWTGAPPSGALSAYGRWSDSTTLADANLNTSGIDVRYANMLGGTAPTAHFVIDTSRNGLGPWPFPAGTYPDPQDWCNPPDRGTGPRPTLDTGVPLLDAYLWVKIPGESDGQCARGLGPVGTVDPEWSQVDPAAGQWFPDMALELAHNATP